MVSVGGRVAAAPVGSCGASGVSTSTPRSGLRPSHPEAVLQEPSGGADFFFSAWLASAGSANPLGRRGLGVLQFALAAGNGVGVQAGDPCEVGDAAATVLLGEEASEEPARAFVGDRDEAVDPAVLLGAEAMWMLLADGAAADMDDTPGMLLCHVTLPPRAVQQRAKVILPEDH